MKKKRKTTPEERAAELERRAELTRKLEELIERYTARQERRATS
jgi:hypothetical protein